MTVNVLSEDEQEIVREWLVEGYTQVSIAKAFGISQPAVSYYAGQLGLVKRRKSDGKVPETHEL